MAQLPIHMASEFFGEEERCVYLPGERSRMSYRYLNTCSPETYQTLLERGWRRFGRVFFRPACASCSECRSLRVDVRAFQPNRSMQRTERRNRGLNMLVRRPTLTEAHLDLYQRYHQDMALRRDWDVREADPEDYFTTFVEGYESYGHEFLLLDGRELIAVALVDLLPQALSAVYCFYDPERRSRALGVFAVLMQLQWARRHGIPYVYLGYRVKGNASMAYKAQYRRHQILQGRPVLDETPDWR
ncbi:MAG: arginyltransferase [Deltaproteobacteria bacterium]|nr:arginyltransferase [Deltaproteobacteria bacterium]